MKDVLDILSGVVTIGVVTFAIAKAAGKRIKAEQQPVGDTNRPARKSVFGEFIEALQEEFETPTATPEATSFDSYSLENEGFSTETEGYSAETAPRRESITVKPTPITEVVENESIAFDPATDFDLRRAIIEAEILTNKYL